MSEWTLPGYTEIRELGTGASGRVMLADRNGVPVAIKYLTERSADTVARFREEARLLQGVNDEGVVRLYEYVETAAGAAIVMELVDGVSLRQLLTAEGATGPEAALYVLKGSLLGLAAAHATGVVHRDYKPENVLVDAEGHSKLTDFGVAIWSGQDAPVEGTPAYMAPEQWNGVPAGPATDVYAASVVFFECITGHRPYQGKTLAALALQHVSSPIPLEEVPEPLRPLLARGMAKDAFGRPESAAAFVTELESTARAAYGEDWEERGRRRLAALALLFVALFPLAAGHAASTTLHLTTLAKSRLGRTIARRKVPIGIAAGAAILAVLITAIVQLQKPPAPTEIAAESKASPTPIVTAGSTGTPTASPTVTSTATGIPTAPSTPGTAEPPASDEPDPSTSAPTTEPIEVGVASFAAAAPRNATCGQTYRLLTVRFRANRTTTVKYTWHLPYGSAGPYTRKIGKGVSGVIGYDAVLRRSLSGTFGVSISSPSTARRSVSTTLRCAPPNDDPPPKPTPTPTATATKPPRQ